MRQDFARRIERKNAPTLELSVELAARMLILCGVAGTIQDAKFKIQNALDSGAALEKFGCNVELQNGDAGICDDPDDLLSENLIEVEIKSQNSGFIEQVDAASIGAAIGAIGGGRARTEDSIDHAVGFRIHAKIGDEIKSGAPLGVLYCRNKNQAHLISEKLRKAYKIGEEKPQNLELVKEIVS
jgi:thymidine phosphorylase